MFETLLYLLTYPKRMDPMVIFATWGSLACALASIAIAMHIIKQIFLFVWWVCREVGRPIVGWYRALPVPEPTRTADKPVSAFERFKAELEASKRGE